MSNAFPLDFTFQPRRAVTLARNLLAFQARSLLTGTAAMAVAYIFLYVVTVGAGHTPHLMESIWGASVLAGGWVLASGAFTDIHRISRATWWFLVPASILEKYVATIGVLLVALVVGFPLLGLVSDLLGRGLTLLLWHRDHFPFDLFNPVYGWCLAVGLALVPVFLFGSIVFRKMAFFKTILTLFLFVIVVVGILFGLAVLLFGDGNFSIDTGMVVANHRSYQGGELLGQFFRWAVPVAFFGVMPVFFLVAGFLRLTEGEVDHGFS